MKLNNLISRFKRLTLRGFYILGLKFGFNRNFVSVLCYHSISDSADKYAVSLSSFKKQLQTIQKKARFIGGAELEKILSGKKIKNWGVCLTIDDGYQDVKKIKPLVTLLKIPVILFVMSDRKKINREELNNKHKLLSTKEIKALHKAGWTIGCHSATHADLSKLNEKELKEEVVDSKRSLEKELGFKVNYFAYPKGIVNPKILKIVKKAGYKLAFTTNSEVINAKTTSFLLPRTVIDKSQKTEDFPYFISETSIRLRSLLEKSGVWKMLSSLS